MADWGRVIVAETQKGLTGYDPAEVEFVDFFPEAHLIPAAAARAENKMCIRDRYYVRKIVQSHLGKLRLESREGQGASFLIMLPVYDPRRKE